MVSPVDGLYKGNIWLSVSSLCFGVVFGLRSWKSLSRFPHKQFAFQSDTIGSYKSADSFLSAKDEIEEPTVVLRSSALDE